MKKELNLNHQERKLVALQKYILNGKENLEQCKNLADIIIAKQRHGPIGSTTSFDSKLTKFSNYTDEKQQPSKNKNFDIYY